MSESSWLTWAEAAQLVGCPVPTIDWHKRQGRIISRPKHGGRPSLERASVEAFAVFYRELQDERDAAREARVRSGTTRSTKPAGADDTRSHVEDEETQLPELPEWSQKPGGAVSVGAAAAELELSRGQVLRLIEAGDLQAVRVRSGARFLVSADSVRARATEEARWVSIAEAARLAGCSKDAILRAVAAHVVLRHPDRQVRFLNRVSVVSYAWVRASDAEQQQAQQTRAALEPHRTDRELREPEPVNGDVWLDTVEAALVLGVTANRVRQLSVAGLLAFTERSGRRWYRRSHTEQTAAARRIRAERGWV